jgi:rhomboid protease GluP
VISVRTEQGVETLSLEDFEARVRGGEIAPQTPVRFPVLTGERWVDAGDLELFRRLYEPARIYFARSFRLGRFPVITVGFVIVQVILFFGLSGLQSELTLEALIAAGAKVPANVFELGETWRLLTANILHRDVLHLGVNMFFLFNVGSTIENAYRRQDYILVLLVSGLGTTILSATMSPLPSMGASGVVLGLFGAATVFGYKYADILPRKYRRYLTGAILPYAIFVLCVGLATPLTDNWGHLGGLIGGVAAALPLEPKLLQDSLRKRSMMVRYGPATLSAALVLVVFASGPLLTRAEPDLTELLDPDSGLRVTHPRRWMFGQNHLGFASWGNSLGASVGLRAYRTDEQPPKLVALRKRFTDLLERREGEGEITAVEIIEDRAARVVGGRAVEIRARLESRAGPLVTRNIIIERGRYSYFVVLAAPERWAAKYGRIFDRMTEQIRLMEPVGVRRARVKLATFPGMSSAHVDVGQQLASIGDVEGAATAFKRALVMLPEHPDALYGLARLAVDFDGDLHSAEAIAARLHARRPEDPTFATLLADIRERLGQIDAARAVLLETLDRTPDAAALRERLKRLPRDALRSSGP